MKISKMIKAALGAVICSGLLGLGTAHAGSTCSNATIVQTGVYPYSPALAKYAVYATCNDIPNPWADAEVAATGFGFPGVLLLVAPDDYADPFYAAGLTAASTGNTAEMIITSAANFATVKMLSVKSSAQ